MKLLDTDTCIGILQGVPKVVSAWRSCGERCALSPMSIGELAYGAAKARNPEVFAVTSHNARYSPLTQKVKSMIDEGVIGRPLRMEYAELLDVSPGTGWLTVWKNEMDRGGRKPCDERFDLRETEN